MPRVGLEPKIPVSERTKAFHALNCAVTVIVHDCSVVHFRMLVVSGIKKRFQMRYNNDSVNY
jgi:hypothetical protein